MVCEDFVNRLSESYCPIEVNFLDESFVWNSEDGVDLMRDYVHVFHEFYADFEVERTRRREKESTRCMDDSAARAKGVADTSNSECPAAMAPQNTTQFLLEDREERSGPSNELNEAHLYCHESTCESPDGSDDTTIYEMFRADFAQRAADRLEKLTKEQITGILLELEEKYARVLDSYWYLSCENSSLKSCLEEYKNDQRIKHGINSRDRKARRSRKSSFKSLSTPEA